MEKGDPAASDLLKKVMAAYGWDRTQLADRIGKKKRTIDGIIRGELAMAHDLEIHLQDLLTLVDGTSRVVPMVVKEAAANYDLLKKVIYIREQGTPEQLDMLEDFLDSVCERLGLPRDGSTEPSSKSE